MAERSDRHDPDAEAISHVELIAPASLLYRIGSMVYAEDYHILTGGTTMKLYDEERL